MTTTTAVNNALQELLTEQEVARILKVSVATIRRRRLLRQPPNWVKIGASVRYQRAVIVDLIQSGEQQTGGTDK